MKKIVVFGGTGGLGKKLIPLLEEKYTVISIGSKEVDITEFNQVQQFFSDNDFDIVLNMSGKKYDVFLSKIKDIDQAEINQISSCLPKMIEKKYGRIISISSVFAELNVPKNSIYCASKSFVDRLVSTANKENIKFGITCNTIQLGYWDGGMCDRVDLKYKEAAKEKIGLKRWGTADELYKTIDFIIENEYVAGTNLRIDGGL